MSLGKFSVLAAIILISEAETPTQVFLCECCEIFKNTFFTEHLPEIASVIWLMNMRRKVLKTIFTYFLWKKETEYADELYSLLLA